MLSAHSDCFYYVADRHDCWIGLREPNPLADRWIGIPGFRPKPLSVKAKSADNPTHRLGGLVVDPTICEDAFKDDLSHERALASWRKSDALPAGAYVVERGGNKGLVRLDGQGIHADYDLMCIILADRKGNMTYTLDAPSMKKFYLVQCMLNSMFGIEMIQHGPEFDPNWHGVGAKENELVLYFGPKGRYIQGNSSMRQRHEAH